MGRGVRLSGQGGGPYWRWVSRALADMQHVQNPYAAPQAEVLPQPERQYDPHLGEQRPRAATVYGTIAVGLGGLNVLFIPFVFINRADQMRIFEQMGYSPLAVYLLQTLIPSLFLALLVIGRGLLKVRLWAPRAFCWYAVVSVGVLLLRSAYVGYNLISGVRPQDPYLHLTMIGQLAGDGLLALFALVGLALFSRRTTREAFVAYRAKH